MAYYVFIYSRKKDRKEIRLQWFKELVIQPKIEFLEKTFDHIIKDCGTFSNANISENQIALSRIKNLTYNFRKEFVDRIQIAAPSLRKQCIDSIDHLIEHLSERTSQDIDSLMDRAVLDRDIIDHVRNCRREILRLIYMFDGK